MAMRAHSDFWEHSRVSRAKRPQRNRQVRDDLLQMRKVSPGKMGGLSGLHHPLPSIGGPIKHAKLFAGAWILARVYASRGWLFISYIYGTRFQNAVRLDVVLPPVT